MQPLLHYSPEVKAAFDDDKPIVALESTIISHGMPYPDNLNCVKEICAIIRDESAIPAVIVIYDGYIHIGLEEELLEFFASDTTIQKASKRDLSFYLANGTPASTTVAATLYCAHIAGIDFFVTGGIGGVHLNANDTFDISADIDALATTPIAIICSGMKSILDIPKTIEALESRQVSVVGYQTASMPTFYTRDSEYKLSHQASSVESLCQTFKCHKQLALPSSLLIANPVPEPFSIDNKIIDDHLAEIMQKPDVPQGKALTPYLLKQLSKLSEGQSLETNKALITNNARLGAQLAVNYQHMYKLKSKKEII